MSMASVIAGRGLEAVVWDKDMLGKDYMGELSLPMKEWFPGGTVVFMHEDAPVRLLPILLPSSVVAVQVYRLHRIVYANSKSRL
jgi:hypothetical protein